MTRTGQTIRFGDASVEFTEWGCITRFGDGSHYEAFPHDTHRYHAVSHQCGYGDDIISYCRVHELCHLIVANRIMGRESLIWLLANGQAVTPEISVPEECLVMTFQRWLHANIEPIVGDCDWHGLKAEALALLHGA